MLSGLLDLLARYCLGIVESLGYVGVFLLMVLESMIFPVPSEAVLPPAGWLAFEGRMDLWIVLVVATLGTIVGSLLSYGMGAYGVRPLIERYGRYVFVTPHHLDMAHAFFEKRGAGWAIFLSRFIPIVRHLISIPAGSARMPLGTFIIATAAGGAAWNLILIAAGYQLGQNWHEVTAFIEHGKWAILAAVAFAGATAVAYYYLRRPSRAKAVA